MYTGINYKIFCEKGSASLKYLTNKHRYKICCALSNLFTHSEKLNGLKLELGGQHLVPRMIVLLEIIEPLYTSVLE